MPPTTVVTESSGRCGLCVVMCHSACNASDPARRGASTIRPRPTRSAYFRHVTKPDVMERCRWCGRQFARSPGAGRPRRFCRQGCRQQAHMARKLAASHGLGDDDLIVSRADLEELQGRLYCLQAALEDVTRDLEVSDGPDEVRDALRWLRENAEPVASCWIEPRSSAVT